jgi:integrase
MSSADTRTRKGLTVAQIEAAKPQEKPYKLTDRDGLVLVVNRNGSKLWRRRLRVNGRETMISLGAYGKDNGLKNAREAADQAFKLAREGINPSHHRKAERAKTAAAGDATFRALAGEWIERKQEGKRPWTKATVRQRRRLLEQYVYPKLGSLPVAMIDSALVYDVLETIHAKAPAQTAFARQCVRGIMQLAIIRRLATVDPSYVLRGAHEPPRTVHHRPLKSDEVKPFFAALESSSAQELTKIAVRLAFWTLARSKEVIGARWSEFDLEAGTWEIPTERMKKREPHTVPLPFQAVETLRSLRALMPHREVLFPNAHDPKRPAAHTFMNRAVTRLGFKGFSAHGIRSTGSTMLHDMKFRPEIIEAQLAHKERNKTKASYNRAEYLEERRQMNQQLADTLDALCSDAKVQPIRRAA